MPSGPRSQESRFVIAEIQRLTGKRYPQLEAVIENVGPAELRELVQLTHDLNAAVRQAERRAAMQPWRFGR